jgi:hypothetical protein
MLSFGGHFEISYFYMDGIENQLDIQPKQKLNIPVQKPYKKSSRCRNFLKILNKKCINLLPPARVRSAIIFVNVLYD